MSSILRPFAGYLPEPEFAPRIVGPTEALLKNKVRANARLDPMSFRNVVGRGAASTRDAAKQWVEELVEQGALRRFGPAVLVHRLTKGEFIATGILADVSIAAYDSGVVKKHESTIAASQQKMAHYIRTTRIYGNPVALAHRPNVAVSAFLAEHVSEPPDSHFLASDGTTHELWVIEGDRAFEFCANYSSELYITDGHHRLAAASLVASEEERHDAYFPAALFSQHEWRLRSFLRCVTDPNIDETAVIERLRSEHQLEEVDEKDARPREPREFGMAIGDRFFLLQLQVRNLPTDPYELLDVNLLRAHILGPIFDVIADPNDSRLSYVEDTPAKLKSARRSTIRFLPYPSSEADVMAIADEGLSMPPKSTWFAPKIPSGLVLRFLDP